MKKIAKVFWMLGLGVFLSVVFVGTVGARMPDVYPNWSYSAGENACEVNQYTAEDEWNDELKGNYFSIYDCRSENKQVIFSESGGGIVILTALFLLTFVMHYLIYPKLTKRTTAEKAAYTALDIQLIVLAVLGIIVLDYYFSGQSIERELIATVINKGFPAYLFFLYLFVSFARGAWYQLSK